MMATRSLVTSLEGKVIRLPAEEIRTMGRSTMGVTIMKLGDNDKVTAIARLVGEKEEKLVAETEVKEDLSVIPVGPDEDKEE